MALIEAVAKGSLPASRLYADRLATCAGCLACEAACASGVPVTTIIAAAKEEAVRETGRGVVSAAIAAGLRHPFVMRSLAWLAPVALHFGKQSASGKEKGVDRKTREQRRTGRRKKNKGKIAFFPGCAVRYFQQDIADAVNAVLGALGYEVVVPRGLQCCGRPFLSLGDREAAVQLARKNRSVLALMDVDAVVTACASCGLTFKREYPELLVGSGLEPVAVLDIHEFLRDKLGALGLGSLPRRATWHDPCHLGRGQGLGGTARSLLRAVPGITFAEMTEPAKCCGFGGVMRATHPLLSAEIGEAKAKDIRSTGADLVVTGCPGCRMQIGDALRRIGTEAEVVHTVQVIAAALRVAGRGDGKTGSARIREEQEDAAAAGCGLREKP